MVEVRRVAEDETRTIRQQVLRPHQPPADLQLPSQTAGDGYFGAFLDDSLTGVIIVQPEYREGSASPTPWRLRGLAVLPEHRRSGIGRLLVERAIDHVRAHGGSEVWCHGRSDALAFYRDLGFQVEGKEFVKPPTGPHYVMVLPFPGVG